MQRRTLASLALLSLVAPWTLAARAARSATPQDPSPPPALSPGNESASLPVSHIVATNLRAELGCELEELPEALRVHLDESTSKGLLVSAVDAETPAARAGLEVNDVLLGVDGTAVDEDLLRAALRTGAQLTLLRRGSFERVALVASQPREAGFLSPESLPADDPLRRLEALAALRAQAVSDAERSKERLRALEQEENAVRREAVAERETRKAECAERVAADIVAFLAELNGRVAVRLADTRADELAALALSHSELVPEAVYATMAAQVEEWNALVDAAAERLGSLLPEDADRASKQVLERARTLFSRDGKALVAARLGGPLERTMRELEEHGRRIGPQYDERVAWVRAALEQLRGIVEQRSTNDGERVKAQLAQELDRRLQRFELPAAGEVEGALESVEDQIRGIAERYVGRAERALAEYRQRVGAAGARLTEEAVRSSSELATLYASGPKNLDARLAALGGSAEARPEARFREEDAVLARVAELETALRTPLHEMEDLVLREQSRLLAALTAHRTICEEAFADLRRELTQSVQEASSYCWNLDGPHLDGRFPTEDAAKKRRAEIVLGAR